MGEPISHTMSFSRRVAVIVAVAAILRCVGGCGPTAPPVETAVVSEEVLQRLTPVVEVGPISRDGFRLTWRLDRQRADIIRGFNVYVSTDSGLTGAEPDDDRLRDARYGGAIYPGDVDGDIRQESIAIAGLDTGTRYYVHVRTAFPTGQLSPPSAELTVIPRPRGEFVLHPRLSGAEDGFSFSEDSPVAWTSTQNDIYMYAVRDTLYLASPSRLNGELRQTQFFDLGPSGSIDEYPELTTLPSYREKVPIRRGRSIALRLDGTGIVKLRPRDIHSEADPVSVTFEYMYQPVNGEKQF